MSRFAPRSKRKVIFSAIWTTAITATNRRKVEVAVGDTEVAAAVRRCAAGPVRALQASVRRPAVPPAVALVAPTIAIGIANHPINAVVIAPAAAVLLRMKV